MAHRSPRADGLRNRAKILAAASQAFAQDGPDVPLDAIAARAGVGPGTVHRHFPTKQSLLTAVVAARLGRLAERGEQLAADPDADFYEFLAELAGEARHNLALAEALGGPVGEEADEAGQRLAAALAALLSAAQQSGSVRPDLTVSDLHAIITGALAMERRLPPDRHGIGLQVVMHGLRNW
jgi:AcrR family transcriptional regulator